jgi:hypothetical protein
VHAAARSFLSLLLASALAAPNAAAQNVPASNVPATNVPASNAAQDAATLLASLSREQKAGQLFMAWSLSRADGKNHDNLLQQAASAASF